MNEKETWRDMEKAPLNGKSMRILLKDGFGAYAFSPCAWCTKRKAWVNAKTGTKLACQNPLGWLPMKSHQEVKYAAEG